MVISPLTQWLCHQQLLVLTPTNSARRFPFLHTLSSISKINKQFINFNTKKANSSIRPWSFRQKSSANFFYWVVCFFGIELYEVLIYFGDARESMERRECSCTVCGNVNWYNHYGKQYGDSLKKTSIKLHLTQKSHYWAWTLKKS